MSGKLTVATCQHAVSGDIAANLAAVKKQLRYARSKGADIAHFPECNLSGYAGIDFMDMDARDNGLLRQAIEEVRKLAAALEIWVILGSHHFVERQEKPFNSLFVINDRGEIVDRYDKRLLAGPDMGRELEYFEPGKRPVVFQIKGATCGLLICHEWRYPELYRAYYHLNVDVLFQSFYDGNISSEAYREQGRELGDLIIGSTRANAAHNYFWISISNTSKRESCYPAQLIRPDGRVADKLPRNRAGVLIGEINLMQKFADPSRHHRDRLTQKSFYQLNDE